LALYGLTPEDYPQDALELWECNAQSFAVFSRLMTQWRIAPSGRPYGLDYSVIEPVMRLTGVPSDDWQDVFSDIRIMEDEALDKLREGQK
jgi:hypothetical protein